MAVRTKLLRSNSRQAVRLPKEIAFPDGVQDVMILKQGAARLIVPATGAWDDFFDAPGTDLPERGQPGEQKRESF